MISRDQAFELLKEHVKADNLIKHCLATEAIMKDLGKKMGADRELWGITGLLHDLDFEYTKETPSNHGLKTAEILKEVDVPDETISAIKAHNADKLGLTREKEIDYAISCAETITGLIVATAFVYPDKKLNSVKPKSIRKRMKEKAFARNVDREIIKMCENIGIPLNDFIELSLRAMQHVSEDLGL